MTMSSSMGHRRATINDVARAANVSRQTVSNAVNRPDRVAPQTLQRVQIEIDRLSYRPSSAAKSLREQRAGAIGLELDARGDAASAEVAYPFLTQLSLAARSHRCHVVTFGTDSPTPTTSGYESMVRAHLVDAFLEMMAAERGASEITKIDTPDEQTVVISWKAPASLR